MSEPGRAKLFWTGRSQAVRLPKEYRFTGKEVAIRKEGDSVILEPIEKPAWPRGFWAEFDRLPPLPDDFEVPERPVASVERAYRERVIEDWLESNDESS
jgi:antitoxin VapB